MLNGNNRYILPEYLTENEKKEISAFLQGAVYLWCSLKGDAEFAARDFIGGTNYFWKKTPLYKLYEHYEINGNENSEEAAGKDAGILLKEVLINDKRTFEQFEKQNEKRKYYKWDGDTSKDS